LKASIERIEMEYMLAKAQVEKERMSKIAQLDKKRRVDMLVLLGGCTQLGFNTGKPPQRSSLDVVANLSDRPSTSRQDDTLTVSNNDDRLLNSSRDLELAITRDLDGAARLKPQDDEQAEGQENKIEEKSGAHPDGMELPSNDVARVNSERLEANEVATDAPRSVEAVCVEDTNKNLLTKQQETSDNNVSNVAVYAKEVVAQLHNQIDKCSSGEVLLHDKTTTADVSKSDIPFVDEVERVHGSQ
jgi:hypothetical protein